ncbi:transglycosylase [Roseomonas sp. BN140053]|uniref:transglycosylase n=1 Tax=Roseomonas sp. BN140053 TaxID=3391898 RepID=UPI0039E7F9E5
MILGGAMLLAGSALAQGTTQGSRGEGIASPRAACLDAARTAEIRNQLPQGLLVAVALAESGLHAYALNIGGRSHFPSNAEAARQLLAGARPGQSIMAGCVQVNARVHARGSFWPLDPARATDWAAQHLRQKFDQTGNWGDAIRRWNGGAPRTANNLVCRVQAKLQVTNPGSVVLSRESCGGNYARERRNGAELLEIAEASER